MDEDEKRIEWYETMTDHVIEILDEIDDEEFIFNVWDVVTKADKIDENDEKFKEYDEEFQRLYNDGIAPDTAAYKLLAIIKKLMPLQ